MIARLAQQGSLPLPFYPSFVENDNPASGFEHGVAQPRFSQSYFSQRNRLGMLVETHSWKDYPTRVRITRNTVARRCRTDRRAWPANGNSKCRPPTRAPRSSADSRSRWTTRPPPRPARFAFRGYAYTRTPSDDFRRPDDALRREQAADLEHPAARRDRSQPCRDGAPGRLSRADRTRDLGRRQAAAARHRVPSAGYGSAECGSRRVPGRQGRICFASRSKATRR